MYDTSLKRKWDEESIRQSAIIERERAREEGREEGREEERIKAEAKLAKAEAELAKAEAEKRAIALELKKMGYPVAVIAKGTGLSMEAIENLK